MLKSIYWYIALLGLLATAAAAAPPIVLHPAFSPTKAQMKAAFLKGEQQAHVANLAGRGADATFGVQRPVLVPVSGSEIQHPPLTLTIALMTPLEGCRRRGFRFGLTRGRTDADRQDVMTTALRLSGKPITFEADLDTEGLREDDNVMLPDVTVSLVTESSPPLMPDVPTMPIHFPLGGGRDLMANVANSPILVIFPLVNSETHQFNVTNQMTRLILIVRVGETEQRLTYPL